MTKRELIKLHKELQDQLKSVQLELGQRFSLYWTNELGWVSIPSDLELDEEEGKS